MAWNYGGYNPVYFGMMVCMMVGILVVSIIFLIAAWRLMSAHEHIAESIKEYKSKLIGNE